MRSSARRRAVAQPFWKKELSLGRGSKGPKVEVERAPKQPSQPFWKKELSLGRGSKEPKVEVERAPKQPSQPFWKKEISLGRGSKEPKVEVVRAPKQPSQPFWKKELSLGRGSKGPKVEVGAKRRSSVAAVLEEGAEPGSRFEGPKVEVERAEGRRSRFAKRSSPGRASKRSDGGGSDAGSAHPIANVVGLRIGSSQLAAALVNNNGSAELLQLARTPLEPGIVAAGEVRDSVALAQALKRFFAQNKLPRSGVRLGVATNRIGVRVLEVPAMDDPKLLANAIRFRAQEVLPIPLADAVLDHVVLGEPTRSGRA